MTAALQRGWPWLVSFAALVVAGLLLVQEFGSRGATIVLTANRNPGLEEGISELKYRGITCGHVVEIRLDPEEQEARIEVRLEKWADHLAREGSRFWVVAPELEVGRIRGLDALRSGAYLTVDPGDGPEAERFEMLAEAPTVETERAGLQLGDANGGRRWVYCFGLLEIWKLPRPDVAGTNW